MDPRPDLCLEDYLAVAEWPGPPVEWINGQAYAMSGGTPRHAAVTVNLLVALARALQGSGCRAINGDQRVNIDLTGAFVYPDAGIVCGPFVYAENDPHSVTNPVVLFEVLSPSTRDFDQGGEFDHYRRIGSLMHYVLVDPDVPHVIHHARQRGGWFRVDRTDGEVVLDPPGVTLGIDDLYTGLDAVGSSGSAARTEDS